MINAILPLAIIIPIILVISVVFVWHKKKSKPAPAIQEATTPKITAEEESRILVHDLRAPVVAIKDTAALMISSKLSEPDQKKLLNLIHDQSNGLLNQIATILEAAKIDQGQLILKKSLGNLGQIIKEEIALFQSEANRKHIQLTDEIATDLPVFPFDNLRITESINNLISNSLKYTNENGLIKVSVNTDDQYKKSKSDGFVIIRVADNGMGIPPEKMPMLFTKFSDLNASSPIKANKTVSSGLGLYITKQIIDAHGGKISMESVVGKGTTATIYLPIQPKA